MTDLATPTVPEDLTVLDDDELANLLADAVADFDRLHDDGGADLTELGTLADSIDALRAEQEGRTQAAAKAEERRRGLAARVHPAEATDDPQRDPGEDEEENEEDEEEQTVPSVPATPPEDEEPVTAGARTRPTLAPCARRGRGDRPVPRRQPQVTITAAADVPGLTVSAEDRPQPARDRLPRPRPHPPREVAAGAGGVDQDPPHLAVARPRRGSQRPDHRRARRQPECRGPGRVRRVVRPEPPDLHLFDIGPDADGLIDLPSLGARFGAACWCRRSTAFGDVAGALWNWTEAKTSPRRRSPPGREAVPARSRARRGPSAAWRPRVCASPTATSRIGHAPS